MDYQIPDSGGTATALLSGRKVNAWTVGVNENVQRSNCSNEAENKINGILHWSLEEGKTMVSIKADLILFSNATIIIGYKSLI